MLTVSLTAIGATASAQGADDCANAQVIAGTGIFPFDNTAATIDGPADCTTVTGSAPVRRDLWFSWIAPTSDVYAISTCSLTTLSTRIAIYDGTNCPPTIQINCAGFNCAPDQSTITFGALAGHEYLFRVGSRTLGPGGTGTFELALSTLCAGIPDDSLEPNDNCNAGLTAMGDGMNPGLFVKKFDDDWYMFEVQANATLTVDVLFTHANGDIDTVLYDGCGGSPIDDSQTGMDNEHISWTNTGPCKNVFLRVFHWTNDPNADCTNYDMDVSGTGTCTVTPIGTNYCTAMPNSSGNSAAIAASGSGTLADQNVTLRATGAPNDTVGLFFFGVNQMQVPFGQGLRCVGPGRVQRMLPMIATGPANGNAAGEAVLDIDFSATYAPALTAGQLNFQFWFQDTVSMTPTFNLTNGIQILFQ
ncbi:MAG: hypothetical protein ACI8Y8_003119 [Planctomycetota bacterium]